MNEKPRSPDVIKGNIREFDKFSQSSIDWLEIHPDDKAIKFMVEQDRVFKEHLVKELEVSREYFRKDIG